MAIILALLFSSLLILPAFASSGASTVPLCCRKEGKHHCQMHSAAPVDSGALIATLAAKCPCAAQSTAASQAQFCAGTTSEAVFAGLFSHPAVAPQTEAGYRISYDRSRQKRGPPSNLLS